MRTSSETRTLPINGCILIPAYNEEKRVADVVQAAREFLPVMVIDDGSKDGTFQTASEAGAIVHRQVPNQGKGMALQRGFREIIAAGYDFLITMDADGQHDPAEIPLFVAEYMCEKADLIIGYRDFRKMPLVRRLSNTIGGWAFSWAMRMPVRDNQSGYRLMSRALVELVLESKERGFEYEVEVIVRCVQAGMKLGWVPIRTIYAGETSHIRPGKHLVNFLRLVLSTRKRMKSGS